jgi:sulfate adenylyltransferase subunit 1
MATDIMPAAAGNTAGEGARAAVTRIAHPAGLLRFSTAGSVDDGKSTLIGRLLHDARAIFDDQLAAIESASRRRGETLNLALLTDGLRAEREQGITIDVAYRYFATPRRTFVIADTPGHAQYTRNMVTGGSTADLSIVLVDVRHGVVEQTRRHAAIAELLRVPHVVVAINKMDLAGFEESAFEAVKAAFAQLAGGLGLSDVTYIPISALAGDNVVERSTRMPWYHGPALLEHLETVPVAVVPTDASARLPVQWVIRTGSADPDYRAYAGRIEAGELHPGDEVLVLPAGRRTRIRSIETADGPLQRAAAPMSVSVRLTDEMDVGRGDTIAAVDSPPAIVTELVALACCLGDEPLRPGSRYLLKSASRTVPAVITAVEHRLDIETLARQPSPPFLDTNEIGLLRVRLGAPLAVDAYRDNRATGSFILIDPATNATVAGGMIEPQTFSTEPEKP